MVLDTLYNYLRPDVLTPLRTYIEELGKTLYATDDEVIEGNKRIQAFNMTFTTDRGYSNLSKLYPGFDDYLEKIIDFDCNMVHIVALKGGVGAEVELHQDDTLEEHLENNTKSIHKSVFLGVDPICSAHTSILYLSVPKDMAGGEFYTLIEDEKKFYKPCSNLMIKITGDTWHGATPVTHCPGGRHVIVCEQYKLSKRNLRRLSDYDEPVILRG